METLGKSEKKICSLFPIILQPHIVFLEPLIKRLDLVVTIRGLGRVFDDATPDLVVQSFGDLKRERFESAYSVSTSDQIMNINKTDEAYGKTGDAVRTSSGLLFRHQYPDVVQSWSSS